MRPQPFRPGVGGFACTAGKTPVRHLTYIYVSGKTYIQGVKPMALSITSIRLDKRLADEAAEVLGVKSRTEAIHAALREIVALKRFKKLMSKYGGKLEFSGHDA